VTTTQELKKALSALVQQGSDLFTVAAENPPDLATLNIAYESWYTPATAAIKAIAPDRLADFRSGYKLEKRKTVEADTYTIDDYLHGLVVKRGGQEVFSGQTVFFTRLIRQVAILRSVADSAESILRDIRAVLQAELLDSDLAAARALVRAGHLRSAGVVCGVALEAHLGAITDRRQIRLKKKAPTISDYNDALRENSVIDIPMWRLIQRLADIRNLCCHRKERDPRRDEVDDLITGCAKVVREVF